MTTEHTPGPWFVDEEEFWRDGQIDTPYGFVCTVAGWDTPDDETLPNARLIAAAPDLLAELELIVSSWSDIEAGTVRGRRLTPWEAERLVFARAAIAQARGGAS